MYWSELAGLSNIKHSIALVYFSKYDRWYNETLWGWNKIHFSEIFGD